MALTDEDGNDNLVAHAADAEGKANPHAFRTASQCCCAGAGAEGEANRHAPKTPKQGCWAKGALVAKWPAASNLTEGRPCRVYHADPLAEAHAAPRAGRVGHEVLRVEDPVAVGARPAVESTALTRPGRASVEAPRSSFILTC